MNVLAIIQLALAALQSVLPLVSKSTAYPKIASEISAAIASLTSVQQQIIDLNELESLRTEKLWPDAAPAPVPDAPNPNSLP